MVTKYNGIVNVKPHLKEIFLHIGVVVVLKCH